MSNLRRQTDQCPTILNFCCVIGISYLEYRQVSIVILTFFDTMLNDFAPINSFSTLRAATGLQLWHTRCAYLIRLKFQLFKIYIIDTRAQRKLVVEGKLSEPWVDQLRTTCRNASRDLDGRKLVIDVSSLTVISRREETRF